MFAVIDIHQTWGFIPSRKFQSFDFERTWWRLFQKHVVRSKFDIYVLLNWGGWCLREENLRLRSPMSEGGEP
jgi:hypothetical protein